MIRLQFRHRTVGIATILAVAAGTAFWVLASRNADRAEWNAASLAALRQPSGQPQLVSVEPLPESGPTQEGEMCPFEVPGAGTHSGNETGWDGGYRQSDGAEWLPAGARTSIIASLEQERLPAANPVGPSVDVVKTVEKDLAPVRMIRDTYPTYSAVAVDPSSGELFLQDENLFGLKVFNRLDNTPPSASFTEPKRILGGAKTKMRFNCSLYVDPQSGDVYSVANDVIDTLVIFSHDAKGNVPPKRELKTPHRTYGIAVDEERQELYLTVEYPPEVVVYRKYASGDEKPLRTLEGNRTQLYDPHGIAIDAKNNLMFVSNHGSTSDYLTPGTGKFHPPTITVYPLNAAGDTAPLRVIEGPNTQLDWPAVMALDADQGDLYVANDVGNSVLVFHENDGGNVAPARVIKGPKAGIRNPTGVYLDKKNQELWVSNMGNHSARVYPLAASGDVAPLRIVRSAPADKLALAIGNPGAVAYDSKRDEILVPN